MRYWAAAQLLATRASRNTIRKERDIADATDDRAHAGFHQQAWLPIQRNWTSFFSRAAQDTRFPSSTVECALGVHRDVEFQTLSSDDISKKNYLHDLFL